jgi:hypothetical protein
MKLINAPVHRGVQLEQIRTNVYGVEIELENYQGNWDWGKHQGEHLKYWSLVDDPSLRHGIEMVSTKLTQTRLAIALNIAGERIKAQKLTSESRCGVHVHVNMLNLNWGQVWSFIALYALMEPEIFKKFAPERHENHFCVPMYWNTKMAEDLGRDIDMLRSFNLGDISETQPGAKKTMRGGYKLKSMGLASAGLTFNDMTADPEMQAYNPQPPPMYHGGGNKRWYPLKKYMTSMGKYKYGALTTYRMPDLGTIELRLLPGTTNMKIIKDWVALLGRIKHMAYKYPEPLDLQKHYERHGPASVWRTLKMGTRPRVNPQDKDDAEEGAFKIIGTQPMYKEDFDWTLTK